MIIGSDKQNNNRKLTIREIIVKVERDYSLFLNSSPIFTTIHPPSSNHLHQLFIILRKSTSKISSH